MSTYTQILYHIVFATKNRQRTLDAPRRAELFRYMWGIMKNLDCYLYRINGMEEHLHILASLHPSVSLANFIKTLKVASAKWIKDDRIFPAFDHWQDGYGAFTHSLNEKDALIEYIKIQQAHHHTKSFLDKYRELLAKAGVTLDERYLP